MFPITHIWFSKEVLGNMNNMTVLGAIFPDTAISGFLTHEKTHKVGWRLFDFFENSYSEFLDFAKGIVTHAVDPRGLDFYADEEFGEGRKGYCFQKASHIEREVIEACSIPESFGLWKAHNFIEMGIELNMAESNEIYSKALYDALNDSCLINALAEPLESFFELGKTAITESMKRFAGFVELSHLNSRTLAQKYNEQMQSKHGIKIDVGRSCNIIEKSRIIIEDDFDEFAGVCINNVRNMLREAR